MLIQSGIVICAGFYVFITAMVTGKKKDKAQVMRQGTSPATVIKSGEAKTTGNSA